MRVVRSRPTAVWLARLMIFAVLTSAEAGRSNAEQLTPAAAQSKLDFIAGVPFDSTLKEIGSAPAPSGPFSAWSVDQQRAYPADLGKLCAGLWTFISGADGPPTARLLPASRPGADEAALILDVCLVAHMPVDWPERNASLQAAKAILKEADQAGATLHLPEPLTR